jgi:excisionase family DNA binding protein
MDSAASLAALQQLFEAARSVADARAPKPLLTKEQTARILGVSLQTLANWASAGRGPSFVRVGRLRRYRPEAIEEYLLSNTVAPGEVAGRGVGDGD